MVYHNERQKIQIKEDGSITKLEMEDEFSKVDVSKTDITRDTELVGEKNV